MGRDHDLVGGEDPQRVLDRHVGVRVADLAPRLQAQLLDRDQRELHPLARQLDRFVDVRGPVGGARGGQRRRDDEDLAVAVAAAPADLLQQRLAADRLVGDHEQPVPAVAAARQLDVCAAASRASCDRRRPPRSRSAPPPRRRRPPAWSAASARSPRPRPHRSRPPTETHPPRTSAGCAYPQFYERPLKCAGFSSRCKDVDGDEDDDPHHVDEVPVDARHLDAEVVLRLGAEVAAEGADRGEAEQQQADEDVGAVQAGEAVEDRAEGRGRGR